MTISWNVRSKGITTFAVGPTFRLPRTNCSTLAPKHVVVMPSLLGTLETQKFPGGKNGV